MPRIPGTNVMKRCTKCGEEKPASEFHKRRRRISFYTLEKIR